MAKVDLTPEEIIEKKTRRSNGWTRFWAIVLALVLVAGVTVVSTKQAKKANEAAAAELSSLAEENNKNAVAVNSNNSSGTQSWDDGSASGSGDNAAAQTPEQADQAAEAVKAINAATAAAVKAGYTWTRESKLNKVDVGGLERLLNPIIRGIDEDATIESVVAGFVGAGGDQPKTATIKKGEDAAAVIDYHGNSYKLKATTLEAGDLKNLKVDGDTYTFTLDDATTPKRDGSTALNRLTDDIVIQSEVAEEIKKFTSAITVTDLQGVYSNINVKVVITDGKLVELTYSYHAEVTELGLNVKLGTIHGKGDMDTKATYSDFVY